MLLALDDFHFWFLIVADATIGVIIVFLMLHVIIDILYGMYPECTILTIMIQYGTSVLLRDSQCLDKNYVKKRSELTGFEDTIPSFFRPPLSVKSQMRQLKRRREEREDRKMVNNSIKKAYTNIFIENVAK